MWPVTPGHVRIWNPWQGADQYPRMNLALIRPGRTGRHRSRRGRITRPALVMSVVDTRTGMLHRVAAEIAALHRRSGCYPALCGLEVPAASLTTPAADDCGDCAAWHRKTAR